MLDGNDEVIKTIRGNEPPYRNIAFINPRIENPNDFMLLNMETYEFEIFDHLDKRQRNQAEKTCEILKLNERDTLKAAREEAAKYYYERLDRLVKVLDSNSVEEILGHFNPHDSLVDISQDITSIKQSVKENYQKDIEKHRHPSVWYAIKIVQSRVNQRWKHLFEKLPEALNW